MAGMEHILPERVKYPHEMKCPVALLLDTSGSMSGEPIQRLNQGVTCLLDELKADPTARKRVELAIITFGGDIKVVQPLATVEDISFASCESGGTTPMGKAVVLGLSLLEETKKMYREEGVPYYRPWLVLITDGCPTDMQPLSDDPLWMESTRKIQDAERNKKALCWAFGVEGAEMGTLSRLFNNDRVYKLSGFPFKELFQWLSGSISMVMNSNPGDSLELYSPPGGVRVEV